MPVDFERQSDFETYLLNSLYAIDAECDWSSDEVQSAQGGYLRLQHYLTDVLAAIRACIPDVAHAYVAIAGPCCGYFSPVAAVGRDVKQLAATPTTGSGTLAAAYLHDGQKLTVIKEVATDPRFVGDRTVRDKLLMKLQAHGEFYGFVSLDSRLTDVFTETVTQALEGALPFLTRTISDAIFSSRLRLLAGPFDAPNDIASLQTLFGEITSRAAHGFGCDGALLRIYNPISSALEVEAYEGDIDSSLLEPRGLGEGIAGKVFQGNEHYWAARSFGYDNESTLLGVPAGPEDDEEIRTAGIQSYIVMRLTAESQRKADSTAGAEGRRLGTLAIFHRRQHRFAWRDIGLFKAFCQRVADTIALYQKNIELEEIADTLRIQGLMITRVEIVALLAHDLGHKAYEACMTVQDYIDGCRKSMNNTKERRTHQHLDDKAEKALSASERVSQSLEQIRKLYGTTTNLAGIQSQFEIEDVLDEVEATMAGGLTRYQTKIRRVIKGNTTVVGYKPVLIQVLLNLVINSIDAIRGMKNKRSNNIHIHAHEERQGESRRVIIQFWDEGPGINRQVFPHAQDVFLIGKTSKDSGTGTGLPVARNLLGQYFRGDLTLEDSTTARFKIVLP